MSQEWVLRGLLGDSVRCRRRERLVGVSCDIGCSTCSGFGVARMVDKWSDCEGLLFKGVSSSDIIIAPSDRSRFFLRKS